MNIFCRIFGHSFVCVVSTAGDGYPTAKVYTIQAKEPMCKHCGLTQSQIVAYELKMVVEK